MRYRGRHRPVVQARQRLRKTALVAALTVTALLTPIITAAPLRATADTTTEVDHTWPEWLQDSDIVLNPPGPRPGEVVAPTVGRGYAITSEQLTKYDITATAAGQQEIEAFVERIAAEHGVTASPTGYRVYSLPSIELMHVADAAKQATALVERLSSVPRDVNPLDLAAAVDQAMVELHNVIATVGSIKVYHYTPVPGIDANTVVAVVTSAASMAISTLSDVAALIDRLDVDPAPTVAMIQAAIDAALAQVRDIDLDAMMENLGLQGPTENAEDPSAAAPIGIGDIQALAVEDELGIGSVLVLPTGTSIALVGAAWEEGIVKVTTVLDSSPTTAPLSGVVQQPDPTAGNKWREAGGLGCIGRKQNNTAWYDPCSWWYEHMDDGNGSRWTWGLVQYGTGKSKSAWLLTSLEVQSWRKKGTPDQDWIKWSPDADQSTGSCTTVTAGIDIKAAKLGVEKTLCEQWDIAKGEQPADFANRWRSGWNSVNRKERATAMTIGTNTPNGYVPYDVMSFDYYAR